jgi:transcriptional regulator with XRE-family HTH domain
MVDDPLCPTCGQPVNAAERRVREALKSALIEQEMTQAELATRLGVTQKHISQVLSGKSGLSFDFAERIGAVLGVLLTVDVRPSVPSTKEPTD